MHYFIAVVLVASHAAAGYVGFTYGKKVQAAAAAVANAAKKAL